MHLRHPDPGHKSCGDAGDGLGGVFFDDTCKEKLLDSIYGNITTNLQSNGRGGGVSTNYTKTISNGWHYKKL